MTRRDLEVTAHRGASASAPENTMAAFQQALDIGADRIELDVHLTQDGVAIVLHDATVDRTTDGEGRVDQMTWNELEGLDAGSWKSEEFRGEPIPSLARVLAWAAGRMPLNIELKNDEDDSREYSLALVRATVVLVEQYSLLDSTLFSSFSPQACAEAVRLCPASEVAFLWSRQSGGKPLELAQSLGARALHLSVRALDPELVEAAHSHGLAVRVYTVNSEKDLRTALYAGVDGVITDVPHRVLRLLNQINH